MQMLRKLVRNKDGATAVEAAIVFPILFLCLFGIFGVGSFMYGSHQAQRTVEETARQAWVANEPSQSDLLALLNQNMKNSMFGTYTPSVEMVTQHGGEYAELLIDYDFNFDFPFLNKFDFNSQAKTQVRIRQMPV